MSNDLARYYRTLCIEYKAKVDTEAKDWCTRNIKLRHSRKLWYFSSILSVVALARSYPYQEEKYINALMEVFDKPPYVRLAEVIDEKQKILVGRILDRFSWFLEFMANPTHRDALATTEHAKRYESSIDNPFPVMKLNSDMMHREMIYLIESLDVPMRHLIFDWFSL